MFRHSFRYLLAPVFLLALTAVAPAQDKDKEPPPKAPPPKKDSFDEYRQYLKPPVTVPDFWGAIQFEIELGSYELAARHLRALMEKKKPTDEELYDLERQVGMVAMLRLRNISKWSTIAKEQADTVKDVDALIEQTTAAVRKHLGDPLRIKKYIALLYASTEEQQFALRELYQSGAAIVPHMIDELKVVDADKRGILLATLRRLGPEILPPLVAALDSSDAVLKMDLIDLFLARASREVTPHLWFLAASPAQPEQVRDKARNALAYFSLPPERLSTNKQVLAREVAKAAGELPPAKDKLTREAEKYYRHLVRFADDKAVTVWRWDGRNVVAGWPGAPTVSASKAEEYYGVRFAGQALALDPAYKPAQNLMVSLLLEKSYEQGGFDRPLAKADPNVQAVVSSINPDVIVAVLEHALDEKRVPLILATTRMLGDLAEVRATRPTENADPALMRALLFADRRVQMAAAEALLRVPGDRSGATGARIVEVLRRALAAEEAALPKVLVGYANEEFANKVVETAKQAGYESIVVKTGRDLLKRLFAASDIEAIILDTDLPDPGFTSLLGQLRGDAHASRLPLFITPSHQKEDLLLGELRQLDEQLKGAAAINKPALQLRRDQIDGQLRLQAMTSEAALERFAKMYRNVIPLTASNVINMRDLQPALQARLDVAVNPPLAGSELKDYAEKAVRYLARAAKGELVGLDATVAADAVYRALRTKKLSLEGQLAAIEIIGRLPGHEPQTELLRAVLDADDKRPAAVRLAAASELVRHIQRNSAVLSAAEVVALHDGYAKSTDAAYRAAVAQVFGVLRPDTRTTGDILRGYQPKPPGAPAPMPMPPKPEPVPEK